METILDAIPNYRDIHNANFDKATTGTGPCFPEWEEYCRWLAPLDTQSQPNLEFGPIKTMWGTGIPGAGKTIFASIVINEVELHAKASQTPISVGYIYFRYSDHTRATVRDFLMVLVKQTIERHPNCRPICLEIYDRHIREKTQPSEAELLHLLNRFSEIMITFYFLDAVDEAPPEVQSDLLQKLSSLNVKLFVTSRPLPILEPLFPGAHRFPIFAHDRDLDLHISKEIARSPVLQGILKQGGSRLRRKIKSTIKQKCGGMFLHASLQLDALRDCTSVYDVRTTLEDFPPRMEDVYQRTWNRIIDQTPAKSLLANNVLIWVLCATRSLNIEELRHAVATCPDTHKFDRSRLVDAATLMGLCRGLVTVEKETKVVRFAHYTAKDFVKRLICKSSPFPHSLPAAICMMLLIEHGFQHSTISTIEALNAALKDDPFLAYAYDAWSIHARQSLDDTSTVVQLSEFVQACQSFPVRLSYDTGLSLGERKIAVTCFDALGSLHMVSFFNLPISFAGPDSLRDPNLLTEIEQQSPLHLAVMQNSSNAVKELISLPHVLTNIICSFGCTPLISAVGKGYEDIVKDLLDHPKIDVNQAGSNGATALGIASFGGLESIAKRLLAHTEIDVNQADAYGATALMNASGFTRLGGVYCLLPISKDSPPSLPGSFSLPEDTYWLYCWFANRYCTIRLLLGHPQTNVNMVDSEGRSALMREIFRYWGWGTSQRYKSDYMIKCLIAHPQLDINLVDKEGISALELAHQKGLQGIAELLLAHPQIKTGSFLAHTRHLHPWQMFRRPPTWSPPKHDFVIDIHRVKEDDLKGFLTAWARELFRRAASIYEKCRVGLL
ncbi:hypothetical protein BKA70DRAFT_1119926 [Coprinopsis sp. MPI-PUGE-AT-0042]|nr:hypothetical protein BKA70DRAFT_1119926 [Coprinopsis sp. MPI-PUGE-AT-0042]